MPRLPKRMKYNVRAAFTICYNRLHLKISILFTQFAEDLSWVKHFKIFMLTHYFLSLTYLIINTYVILAKANI